MEEILKLAQSRKVPTGCSNSIISVCKHSPVSMGEVSRKVECLAVLAGPYQKCLLQTFGLPGLLRSQE